MITDTRYEEMTAFKGQKVYVHISLFITLVFLIS